jgi:hypothetical protein
VKSSEHQIHQLKRTLPWIALGCAFSPVLIQLAGGIVQIPFGWSIALAPALMLLAIRKPRQRAQPRRAVALPLLLAGLLAEVVGIAGGSWSIARAGFPVSVVGLALWTGEPRPMTAALALWVVPIPSTLFGFTTPEVESALARIGAAMGALLGADLQASGPLIRNGPRSLELDPLHSGLHLAWIGAELAWYAAVRKGLPVKAAIARAVAVSLAMLPLQVIAVLFAVALLVSGAPDLASIWLDHGVWLTAAIAGLVWIES